MDISIDTVKTKSFYMNLQICRVCETRSPIHMTWGKLMQDMTRDKTRQATQDQRQDERQEKRKEIK